MIKDKNNHKTLHLVKYCSAINLAFLFWLLALIGWHFGTTILTRVSAPLSIASFIIYIRQHQGNSMFKKSSSVETLPYKEKVASSDEKSPSGVKNNDTTVVAKNVFVEGNIVSSSHVYIYGNVKGDINAKEGLVKIMQDGEVKGNINSKDVIVDGRMEGHCTSESLEIAENGNVSGTITYNRLTIKKGGVFAGQAETCPQNSKENNNKKPATESQSESPESVDKLPREEKKS